MDLSDKNPKDQAVSEPGIIKQQGASRGFFAFGGYAKGAFGLLFFVLMVRYVSKTLERWGRYGLPPDLE